MKNVLVIKEVCSATFKGRGGRLVKLNFKALSMVGLAAYFLVFYSYELSAATGVVYA